MCCCIIIEPGNVASFEAERTAGAKAGGLKELGGFQA